jgi:hypothetical protein
MEAKIAYMQYSVVFGAKVIHLFRPSFPQFLSFQFVYLTIDLDKSSNVFLKIESLKVWFGLLLMLLLHLLDMRKSRLSVKEIDPSLEMCPSKMLIIMKSSIFFNTSWNIRTVFSMYCRKIRGWQAARPLVLNVA